MINLTLIQLKYRYTKSNRKPREYFLSTLCKYLAVVWRVTVKIPFTVGIPFMVSVKPKVRILVIPFTVGITSMVVLLYS